MKSKILFSFLLQFLYSYNFSQFAKDGDVTISNNSIVNEYTFLTANVNIGSTSITVNNSALNSNGIFSSNLSSGDLILIIQMQGLTVDQSSPNLNYGSITNYNSCGNYEYAEVQSVPNGQTINLRCGLKFSYSSSGKTQIIRVPRYNNLTINSTITAPAWNGSTGGIVVVEANEDIIINNAGNIDVTGLGFRGAQREINNAFFGAGFIYSNVAQEGAPKGESAFGFTSEYNNINGVYCYGAIANGGGGGNGHNCGGGGGANGGDITNWQNGVGVPNPSFNAAWALESPSISGVIASGGGKGGYSFSGNNGNPLTTAPGSTSWAGDNRRNLGGRGGRPLDYSIGKIFMAGGGGAGNMNESISTGGSGGNGGGIVLIHCRGNLSGTGNINANGLNGVSSSSTNPPFGGIAGTDGAGGGGAGGTIILDVVGNLNGINCNANGGNGGNQIIVPGTFFFGSFTEAEGPGGGGSGGFIGHTNGTITVSINGGINGTTNSSTMSTFPSNGATSGGVGSLVNNLTSPFLLEAIHDTICAGNSATVGVSVNGTLPPGTNLIWYDAPVNGNFIGAGSSFTTGNISNDTTFYVGTCPGFYTIPVTVTIGASFSFNDNNIILSDENCGQSDGSISGITITGGVLPLQYEWNGVLAASQDLNNVEAGTYTLVVTDNNGCASTIGTYTVGENTGPVIDDTFLLTENDHCNQNLGEISGITVIGNAPITYSWDSLTETTLDISNLGSGTYTLTAIDQFGCSTESNPIEIDNIDGPSIDANNLIISPSACIDNNGTISGLSVNDPSGEGVSYFWYESPENLLDLDSLNSGNYHLVVTDTYGCFDSIGPIVIPYIGYPTAGFSISSSPSLINDTVFFTNNSSIDAVNFEYTLSDGNIVLDSNTFEIFSEIGEYEVCLLVSNNFGCEDSICQTIIVNENPIEIVVPNVFTPNGDGENDTFSIQGMENFLGDYSLSIFNRWGNLIFEQEAYLNNWDGKNANGKKVPDGTYFYILKPTIDETKETITGYVMLSR